MKKKSFIFLLLLPFCARAQDSLMSYLEIAAHQNPTVRQKFYDYEAALRRVSQAALPDPEVILGVFVQPMELVMGNQAASLQLMQQFPWFGTIQKAKDEKSLTAKSKFEEFQDAKLQVYFDVMRTWNELQKINQAIIIAKKNVDLLRTIEKLSVAKWKENSKSADGQSRLADTYRIQIEISEVENSVILLEDEKETMAARFNAYLNRNTAAPVLPSVLKKDSLPASMHNLPDSISHHPRLTKILYEQQALDAQKKVNERMGYPSLGVGVNYWLINRSETSTSNMNGQDMIMPMVTFSLPVYRKKYKSLREETNIMRASSEQNYSATSNALRVEYREAMQMYHHAQRRMKLYEHQRSLAQKTLDLMLKSFAASLSPLTDVLRIHQQLLEFDNKEIEAIADNNIAIAWMQRLFPSTTK